MGTPQRRQRILATTAVLLLLLGGGGWFLNQSYNEALLRERYLPELEAQAQKAPTEVTLLSLLATRQLQAQDIPGALQTMERAAKTGQADNLLWRAWALTAQLSGDTTRAQTILTDGQKDPVLAPSLKEAETRRNALAPDAPPSALVEALCPEGPTGLEAQYARTNLVSGWIASWGRSHPETSGFATRQEWAKAEPENVAVQLRWAEALLRNRRFGEAQGIAEGVLTKEPENPLARRLLADTLREQRRYAEALVAYRPLVQKDNKDADAVLGLAQCAVALRLFYLQVTAAEKAVTLRPDSADAWIVLGQAHANQRLRWDRAGEAFRKAHQLAPERLDHYATFYDVLKHLNQPAEAQAILRERLAQHPDDAQAHYFLGDALLTENADPTAQKAAEEALRTACRLSPELAPAQARLGQLLIEKGELPEAASRLRRATTLAPISPQALSLLARAYRGLGQTAEAAQTEARARTVSDYVSQLTPLEAQRSREPTNAAVLRKLIPLYRRGGEPAKAEQAQKALELLQSAPAAAATDLNNLFGEK